MLYRVTLFKPHTHERCCLAVDSHVVGTLPAARLVASAMLKPLARRETNYSSRVTRAPYVQITTCPFGTKSPLGGSQVESVEAPLMIVPSVGDLGWTP